ncbi:TolC family protein [bacterium CPR1]|nr:TolC family protein [bacterium CPR1]
MQRAIFIALVVIWLLLVPARAQGLPVAAPSPSPPPTSPPPSFPGPDDSALTMEDAVKIALGHHPSIASAGYQVQAAEAGVGSAESGYYPQLNLSGSFNHSENQRTVAINTPTGVAVTNLQGSASQVNVTNSASIQANLNQVLLDPTLGPRVESATQGYRASEFELDRTRQDVVAEVRRQFVATRNNQELVRIAIRQVETDQAHLREAQSFYEVGTRARIDVLRAEAQLAQSELTLERAKNRLDVSWVTLNVAMGLPQSTRYHLAEQTYKLNPAIVDRQRLLETALALRPELQTQQARLRATLANLEATFADRLPRLSANMGYNLSGSPSPLDPGWSVGVNLSWALFDGFLTRYQALEQIKTAQSQAEELRQSQNTVYQEVQSNYLDWSTAYRSISRAEVNEQAAKEAFVIAQERYRVGVGSYLEFLDAELAWRTAQVELVQAQTDYHTARINLERAIGVANLEELPPPLPPVEADEIPFTEEDQAP